ncbi:MAG: hypothetical protein Q8Q04_02910 [archaeon]|nr:hypothetical protein [archaeon]
MVLEEMFVHDYLFRGIRIYFPDEFLRDCAPVDEEILDYIDKEYLKEEDLPKFLVHNLSEEETFNGKDYFVIIPGFLHISEYPKNSYSLE